MSILIRGGRVITATDDVQADVLVADGRIAAVGTCLDQDADTVVEATGKLILPGLVDPHTHLEMPFGGTVTKDDFESGHVAAAFGGTTTHVDFCIQPRGATIAESLAEWHAKASGKAIIDYGFHLAVTDLGVPGVIDELAALAGAGISSFKLFMAYKDAIMVDDATLFSVMQVAARTGALVLVHAENGDAIDVLVREALAAGKTEPRYHGETRPPATEAEATNRAIQLARVAGAALYVVHVSCEEALEPVAAARARGWDVVAETCTQYLRIDESFLARPGFEGAKYVFTPPPRRPHDQDVLWDALRRDVLSVLSSDHCAFDWNGQKSLGRDDFSKIPNGAPGIEERLAVVHEFGVRAGRISLNRMVEFLATNPARLFGLYPRKGTIAPGCDADIVVFDPNARHTLSATSHHSRVDYNLYEGTEVTGKVETVLRRGEIVVDRGRLVAEPGSGEFVPRARVGERLEPLEAAAL